MILRPVLMPVPGGEALPRGERLSAQRRAARAALDESARLSGIEPRDWPRSGNGAPLPAGGIYWSLSHKPAWTAAVVSDQPVGIDIEHLAARRHSYVFDRVATADEWALIGDRDWPSFFLLWTAKEATLKANSRGIGFLSECALVAVKDDTHLITSFAGTDWLIEHFYHAEHITAVTAGTEDVIWTAGGHSGNISS